jgi:hypothetical protein
LFRVENGHRADGRIATAVTRVIVMVRMTPINPGTICTAARPSGL